MALVTKPDAAIVDGMLVLYVGGQYMQLPPDIAGDYVRKLQGLSAKLQRQVKREARKAAKHGSVESKDGMQ